MILLIVETAAIQIDYNQERVYYFTHTTQGPCDSPNPLKLDKRVLATTVPNMARSLKSSHLAYAQRFSSTGDISKLSYTQFHPRTPLSLSAQPLATYLGLYINDQVKEGNWLIRTIILDMWYHGKVLKADVIHGRSLNDPSRLAHVTPFTRLYYSVRTSRLPNP